MLARFAYPKQEVVNAERRIRVADRTLDRYVLVQQCAMFRNRSDGSQRAIADGLKELKLQAGVTLVEAGATRPSLFIVGEGSLERSRARIDRIELVIERFVTTQFLGRRALLAELPHPGAITAVTDSLVFELTRERFVAFLCAHPKARENSASALADFPTSLIGKPSQAEKGRLDELRNDDFYLNQIRVDEK